MKITSFPALILGLLVLVWFLDRRRSAQVARQMMAR